jgi:hypothetical protein
VKEGDQEMQREVEVEVDGSDQTHTNRVSQSGKQREGEESGGTGKDSGVEDSSMDEGSESEEGKNMYWLRYVRVED